MLSRPLSRAVRRVLRPPPHACAPPLRSLSLARCLATPAPPTQTPPAEGGAPNEEDAGAPFVREEEWDAPEHGLPQPNQQAGAGGAHNILPPRSRRPRGSGRSDDPMTQTLISRINQINITSTRDPSVPVGSGNKKEGPKKGGKAIQPMDAVEQRGKLTPMQLHRILSTLQRDSAGGAAGDGWSEQRVAEAYSLDPTLVADLRSQLSLPYVLPTPGEGGLWDGYTELPMHVTLVRSMRGGAEPVHYLGEHISVEKEKGTANAHEHAGREAGEGGK